MLEYFQACALLAFEFIHGTGRSPDHLPTWDQLLNSTNDDFHFQLFRKACTYIRRIFLTKDFSNAPEDGLLDGILIDKMKVGAPMKTNKFRPILIYGAFYETLFYLQLDESPMIKKRADEGMEFVRRLSEISPVNFTNKYHLAEGVRLERIDPEQSERLLLKSIHSSKVQKVINDEALCSEFAGRSFFRRGEMVKSKAFLLHAIQCYHQWGASAIVARMNSELKNMYGVEKILEPVSVDAFMKGFVDEKLPNKKRSSSNG